MLLWLEVSSYYDGGMLPLMEEAWRKLLLDGGMLCW
jgi:hypothetical protein